MLHPTTGVLQLVSAPPFTPSRPSGIHVPLIVCFLFPLPLGLEAPPQPQPPRSTIPLCTLVCARLRGPRPGRGSPAGALVSPCSALGVVCLGGVCVTIPSSPPIHPISTTVHKTVDVSWYSGTLLVLFSAVSISLTRTCCSTLYSGLNSRGTSVFTWVSPSDETSFDEDISPLLQYLASNKLVSADARLGLIEFGSETFYSAGNVTFSAGDFTMGVWTGVPPKFDFNPIGDKCAEPSSPTSTGTPKKGSATRTTGGFRGASLAMFGTVATTVVLSQGSSLCSLVTAVVLWWL